MARPGALCALPITMLALLLSSAAPGQARAPTPCRPAWYISNPSRRSACATLTLDASVPNLCAREWIVLAPQPVDLPGQSRIQTSLSVDGQIVSSPNACGQSTAHRPILCAHVPISGGIGRHSLRIRTVYEATLAARRLVAGPSLVPVAPLSPPDCLLLTASTETTDWNDPVFRHWLTLNHLQRMPRENDLAFARRAFLVIRRVYFYRYEPGQDRRASACPE